MATGNNSGATLEPGEPSYGYYSVWYEWVAPYSGQFIVDTEGTTGMSDTELGVYTGTAVNALTIITQDDDSGTGALSRCTFSAIEGTSYKIAVTGYHTYDYGSYQLNGAYFSSSSSSSSSKSSSSSSSSISSSSSSISSSSSSQSSSSLSSSSSSSSDYASAVKFLLHFNNTGDPSSFIDQYSHVFTRSGTGAYIDTSVTDAFGGTGAGYVDGASYVNTPNTSDLDFGTGNFTVSYWMRRDGTQVSDAGVVGAGSNTGAETGWEFDYNGSTNKMQIVSNARGYWSLDMTSSATISNLTWTHIALVRYGNTLTLYINGKAADGATKDVTGYNYNSGGYGLYLGRLRNYNNYYYKGWLDEVYIVKGAAIWTSDFTPPTSPYADPIPSSSSSSSSSNSSSSSSRSSSSSSSSSSQSSSSSSSSSISSSSSSYSSSSSSSSSWSSSSSSWSSSSSSLSMEAGTYTRVLEMGISHSREIKTIDKTLDQTIIIDTPVDNTDTSSQTIDDFTTDNTLDIIAINKYINIINGLDLPEVTLEFLAQIVIYRELGLTPKQRFQILDTDVKNINIYSRLNNEPVQILDRTNTNPVVVYSHSGIDKTYIKVLSMTLTRTTDATEEEKTIESEPTQEIINIDKTTDKTSVITTEITYTKA